MNLGFVYWHWTDLDTGGDPIDSPIGFLLDWVNDVKEAVQHWQLHEYSVLGVSGGGAYAAAGRGQFK